jgi:hypothetical protein
VIEGTREERVFEIEARSEEDYCGFEVSWFGGG